MTYSSVIIGFGKAGKTLAGWLAAHGERVALIEKSPLMYGGTCINVACIPTKSLVNSAEQSAQQAGSFAEQQARYAAAIAEKQRLTGMLRRKNYEKLNAVDKITIVDGTASFLSPSEILVVAADGSERTISGEKIFINTGSRPVLPPIPLASKRVYTNETLMQLTQLPRRLVIVGGGYIGMEFASIYAHFGAAVTVLQNGSQLLPREDRDMADAVQKVLEQQGVRFLTGAAVTGVREGQGVALVSADIAGAAQIFEAEAVLMATGRRPHTDGLQLEKAGVQLTDRGGIVTDEQLRTTAPHIWAMGDVRGEEQFTYLSLDDFRIVRDSLTQGPRTKNNRGAVPYNMFLTPAFSRVGMGEQQAKEQGYDVLVARLPAAAIPKAQVLRQPDGLLKAIVNKADGRILGAHLFCAESYELINQIKMAMDASLPYTVLRDAIYTHPTMSEAFNDLFQL